MRKNIGPVDRNVRIVIGLGILLVGLLAGSWWGLIGLIPLVTGLVRWCPIYVPFNISTLKKSSV